MEDLAIAAIAGAVGAAAPGAMKVLHTLVRIVGIPLQKLLTGMAEARAKERLAQADAKVKITATEGDAQAKLVTLEGDRKAALALQENRIQDMTLEMDAKVRQSELELRRDERIKHLESIYQKNFESISAQALTFAAAKKPEDVATEIPHPDRISDIYEYSKTCSDEQMQSLWAQILADEITKPGSFSPQTLAIVKTLSKADAHLFTRLCSFVWKTPVNPMVIHAEGMSVTDLTILDSLGLIKVMGMMEDISITRRDSAFILTYFDRGFLYQATNPKLAIPLGKISLTRAGAELVPIAGAQPDYAYMQRVLDTLRNNGTPFQEAKVTIRGDNTEVTIPAPSGQPKQPPASGFAGSTTA